MLLICLIIAFVLVGAVVLRFAEGDDSGNAVEHHQQGEPRDDEDPDLMAAAA